MIAWRFIRIIVHLFAGMLTCAVIFPWTSTATHEALIRVVRRNLAGKQIFVHGTVDTITTSVGTSMTITV